MVTGARMTSSPTSGGFGVSFWESKYLLFGGVKGVYTLIYIDPRITLTTISTTRGKPSSTLCLSVVIWLQWGVCQCQVTIYN